MKSYSFLVKFIIVIHQCLEDMRILFLKFNYFRQFDFCFFWTFPCYKKKLGRQPVTDDISSFLLPFTLNSLFNNRIKLC